MRRQQRGRRSGWMSLRFEAPEGRFALCLDICLPYIRSGDASRLNSPGWRGDDRSITLFVSLMCVFHQLFTPRNQSLPKVCVCLCLRACRGPGKEQISKLNRQTDWRVTCRRCREEQKTIIDLITL